METQISSLTCTAGHFDSLIELGRTFYPDGHQALSKVFLKWLYLDNPAGPATLIVAHEDDAWIGVVALIPVILENQGKRQNACFAVNVLSHPDHRQKNLFVKMIKCAREALTKEGIWLLGHPNASAFPIWKRQKMMFRDSLIASLAKFNSSLLTKRVRRIGSLEELAGLSPDFWDSLKGNADVHINYTPEFIRWRFLDAPHRKYVVSAVEKRGTTLGLRVTRQFKGPIDLMVDFVAPNSQIHEVLSSVYKPTIVMHAGVGCSGSGVISGCWTSPLKRIFPFFVTTWDVPSESYDMTGITLGASDF